MPLSKVAETIDLLLSERIAGWWKQFFGIDTMRGTSQCGSLLPLSQFTSFKEIFPSSNNTVSKFDILQTAIPAQ